MGSCTIDGDFRGASGGVKENVRAVGVGAFDEVTDGALSFESGLDSIGVGEKVC